jgi:hypothetical protein
MRINVEEGRRSPEDKSWDLPPWGHPLAQGVSRTRSMSSADENG